VTCLPPLGRRALAEAVGTGLLVMVLVGSGIAAQRLSAGQTGLQLLENATATAAGLVAIILMVGPVSGGHLWLAELVASAGLVLLVFALVRSGRSSYVPAAVGAYIGAAYWFTSSTSFANPAVTIGRMFTDTFAGIKPSSVPGFLLAQVAGLLVGAALVLLFYPRRAMPAAEADAAVLRRADLPPAYPDLEAGPGGGPRPGLPVPTAQGRPW